MAFLGNLAIFDHKTCEWDIFKGRLLQFVKVNKVEEDFKSAILITHLSDESYRLVRNLAYPSDVDTKTFKELVLLLDTHFKPRQCSFADMAKFHGATRSAGESLGDWAARLRGLASYCDFGTALETNLRDRFVLGLGSGPERDKLFEQNPAGLTFARALELAQQAECTREAKQLDKLVIKDEPIYRASFEGRSQRDGSTRRGNYGGGGSSNSGRAGAGSSGDPRASGGPGSDTRCAVCGMKNHTEEKCRFKSYRCQKCRVKGHLKKVCDKSKYSRINNIDDDELNSGCEECQNFNIRFQN
ncbi:uncharacterized protein LOC119691463 [Plutella xylostella]|uniref:uncharacterized protein LOC119691463 n=1 Tax=Plutella xylostella TaxID=51655 RepID=UPI0020324A3C|nr:uncharacterized protein LOC119691463 [Plutella xylostella]